MSTLAHQNAAVNAPPAGAPFPELMRCPHCKGEPASPLCDGRTETGVSTWETRCDVCGRKYTWRVRETPEPFALLADDRKAAPALGGAAAATLFQGAPPAGPPADAAPGPGPTALDMAGACLGAGISFLPVKADGSKAPAVPEWTPYQKRLPTRQEKDDWFGNGSCHGIGVIGGKVSGNLVVIDSEYPDFTRAWCELAEAEDASLVASLPHVQTPGKSGEPGDHFYLRSPAPVPGGKLAKLTPLEAMARTGDPGKTTAIEVKGEGGYVLAPGCPLACHESGRPYRHVGGPFIEEVPTLTAEQVRVLLDAARALDQAPAEAAEDYHGASGPVTCKGRPGDCFNRDATWEQVLKPHGWTNVLSRGEVVYWRRPGKAKGYSATTGYCRSDTAGDLLCVFSTNADPLTIPDGRDHQCFSKFAAYTFLEHGGDFKEAAKALAARGYGEGVRLVNYFEVKTDVDGEEKTVKVGYAAAQIRGQLESLIGKWPKRVGQALFVPGGDRRPLWLPGTDALFAWVGSAVSWGDCNQVSWVGGQDKVSQAQFHNHLTQAAESFEAVEAYPHYPELPGHFYLHPPPAGGPGDALTGLLARFRPATPVDRDLTLAFYLTLAWGGKPGQRPAFFIAAEPNAPYGGRGVGKSKYVQLGSLLVGGHVAVRRKDNVDQLLTRLLSADALALRVVLLDNLKELNFSWDDLEAMITCDTLSGHRMYVGEGRRPNTLLWCLTSNRATLSKDLARRCAVIGLAAPRYDPTWEATTVNYINERRWEILGDLLAELRRPVPPLARFSRWGAWEQEVLAHVTDPAACQKVLEQRQAALDADQEEADLVREGFMRAIRQTGQDPARSLVWITTQQAVRVIAQATEVQWPITHVSAHLASLGIPELRKSDRAKAKGWTWRGTAAPPDAKASTLEPRQPTAATSRGPR
jgi:hypothetical protein